MNINKSLKVVRGIVDEAKPKTESSNRIIELTTATLQLLKDYKSWQDNYIKWVGKKYKEQIEYLLIFMAIIYTLVVATI